MFEVLSTTISFVADRVVVPVPEFGVTYESIPLLLAASFVAVLFVPVVFVPVVETLLTELGCVVSADVAKHAVNKPIAIVNTKLIINTLNFICAS
jgi:hypothetical protein